MKLIDQSVRATVVQAGPSTDKDKAYIEVHGVDRLIQLDQV